MPLCLKSPCLKKNDTPCQRYRKLQPLRMADTKTVSFGITRPRYRIPLTAAIQQSREWNIASRNNATYMPCAETPLTRTLKRDNFVNWNRMKLRQLERSFLNMVLITVMSKQNSAEYQTPLQNSKESVSGTCSSQVLTS